ncbi:uncharacterized protein CEXT_740451 [Caerostris extrusa]|uniref:Promethin n=1 Tax=Caerostris extrusa TaxID=172846 RepID=A0AAV4YF55_CAEEX|nr:uncharacterized protein CEXT_740451 [Caerostris extrusa]
MTWFLIQLRKMSMEEINYQLHSLGKSFDVILQNIFGQKYYSDLKYFAVSHPFILTGVISVSLFSAIPFLFFLGFTIITLFIALLCFLCIEGSIIAIGGLVFVGIVSFITIVVGAIISAFAVAFWILQSIKIAFNKASKIESNGLSEKSSPASSIEEIAD